MLLEREIQKIRLSRIQLKFREISSCFILETDFRFEFLVQNMHVLRISSTYGKVKFRDNRIVKDL